MKINNFQIMIGDNKCNASCKFCVSRLTYPIETNYPCKRLEKVKQLAHKLGITTAIITGKGEPTLVSSIVLRKTISELSEEFPIIELQTNGLNLKAEDIVSYYYAGLTTISISRNHYDDVKNNELMHLSKPQPLEILENIKVPICKRFTTTICKGYIDSPEEVDKMILFAQQKGFEQITLHPIGIPAHCKNKKIEEWILEHELTKEELIQIGNYLQQTGNFVYTFNWGGSMYDVHEVTVVFGFCMDTLKNKKKGSFHSLILGTDGHIRMSWEQKGSVLL